jgi:integrase
MGRRSNHEGTIMKRPDGRWHGRISIGDGTRKHLYGKTRQEVANRMLALRHDLNKGLPLVDERQTLGRYLDSWLSIKKPEVEPSYWLRCDQYVRLHIKPTLGRVSLAKVSAQHLQALYARELEEGVAPNSVRHLHATIHVALEDALRLNLVTRNVADLVRPPKAPHLEMKTYTPEQANQLLEAARDDRLEALYILMLTSACRLGELLGLRWPALDLERGEMQIASTLKEVSSHRSLGTPKTPRSRRMIPLTPDDTAHAGGYRSAQAPPRQTDGRAASKGCGLES